MLGVLSLWVFLVGAALSAPVQAPVSGKLSPSEDAPLTASRVGPQRDTPKSAAPRVEETPVLRARAPVASEIVYPPFRVFGRVVDESGHPLAGLDVQINSYCDSWREAHETEEGVSAWWHEGWSNDTGDSRITTAEDGTFELRGVIPDGYDLWLEVRSTPDRTMVDRWFTDESTSDELLAEGDNDLGTITLRPAGAITGVVMGSTGRPLRGVRVDVGCADREFWETCVPWIETDSSGRFTIPHLLPTRYEVLVEASGFMDARREGIFVCAGKTIGDIDFVLGRSPTISGRVVDDRGRPAAEVRVTGQAVVNGVPRAHCLTDEDGAFLLELEGDVDHYLHAWSACNGRFEPGSSGVEVVIPSPHDVQFAVVDARTGEPVEEFGLEIENCSLRPDGQIDWQSSRSYPTTEAIPPVFHEQGRVVQCIGPGDRAYAIQAPGYAPQREGLRGRMPQVIRLEPEASIRGRLELLGEPVCGASVRLRRRPLPQGSGRVVRDGDRWSQPPREFDLDEFTGRLRETCSAEDGCFEITGLAAGSYCLELDSERSGQSLLNDLRVESRESLDLGELRLSPGSTVRGTVRVAPGLSAEGALVNIASNDDEDEVCLAGECYETTVRPDGTFAFPGLTPRSYVLWVDGHQGLVRGMERIVLEVFAGRDVELKIDLRPWQPCRLRLQVNEHGRPIGGVEVNMSTHRRYGGLLGITDQLGLVDVYREPEEGVTFELSTANRCPIGRYSIPTDLRVGGDVEVQVDVATGILVLDYPPGYIVPKDGELQYQLTVVDGPDAGRYYSLYPLWSDELGRRPTWEVGPIAAGRYQVLITVYGMGKLGHMIVRTNTQDVLRGEVDVHPGGRAVCELASAER